MKPVFGWFAAVLLSGVLLFVVEGAADDGIGQHTWPLVIEGPTFPSRLQPALLGKNMAVGDLNGDGIIDLAMGAPLYSPFVAYFPSVSENGSVYVKYGRPGIAGTFDLSLFTSSDVRIDGPSPNATFPLPHIDGPVLTIGDVNGDGVGDLVVGYPRDDQAGRQDAGSVYIFFGNSPSLAPGTEHRLWYTNTADVHLYGAAAYDHFGSCVTVKDLNRDGEDDLLVSAPFHNFLDRQDAGAVYVFTQLPTGPDMGDPLNYNLRIGGAAVDDYLGGGAIYGPDDPAGGFRGVAAGDVTGDAAPDLILAASGVDALGRSHPGAVYLIPNSFLVLNEVGRDHDLVLDDSWFTRWIGTEADGGALASIAVGDVTGDGVGDIVIGDYFAFNMDPGAVFVIYGPDFRSGTLDIGSPDTFNVMFTTNTVIDHLGIDVDIIYLPDLLGPTGSVLMVAEQADFNGRLDAGATYVRFGGTLPSGTGNEIDLRNPANYNLRFIGESDGVLMESRGGAGDFNGDGFADLVIASARTPDDIGAVYGTGSVYVVNGPFAAVSGVDVDLAVPVNYDVRFNGPRVGTTLMASAAGDFNGDGIVDIAFTSSGSASVFVVYGGDRFDDILNRNLDLVEHYNLRFMMPAVELGASVHVSFYNSVDMGDVTGDELADLVIGGLSADTPNGSNSGTVYVVPGAPNWKDGTYSLDDPGVAQWRFDGPENGFVGHVTVAELTGDAIQDIVMAGIGDVAGVYVVPGSTMREPGIYNLVEPSNYTVRYTPAVPGQAVGGFLAAGDFNANEKTDLAFTGYEPAINGDSVVSVFMVLDVEDVTAGSYEVRPGAYTYRFAYMGTNVDYSFNQVSDAYPRWGLALAMGDLTGDGRDELVIASDEVCKDGSCDEGEKRIAHSAVYIVRGSESLVPGNYSLTAPSTWQTRYVNSAETLLFSRGCVRVQDADGDGRKDLLIGVWRDIGEIPRAGSVYALKSRWKLASGTIDLALDRSYDERYDGSHFFGWLMPLSADVTGDGIPELFLSSPFGNGRGLLTGVVEVLNGRTVRWDLRHR